MAARGEEVRKWLANDAKLERYFDNFVQCGLDTLSKCSTVDDSMLDLLGIELLGRRKRLKVVSKKLQERLENKNAVVKPDLPSKRSYRRPVPLRPNVKLGRVPPMPRRRFAPPTPERFALPISPRLLKRKTSLPNEFTRSIARSGMVQQSEYPRPMLDNSCVRMHQYKIEPDGSCPDDMSFVSVPTSGERLPFADIDDLLQSSTVSEKQNPILSYSPPLYSYVAQCIQFN